jgi:YesN/AraC family two-component response regulator
LEAFKSSPQSFDLVISDMSMPIMSGDQLAMELISIKPDILVIICTGFSERINKERAEACGIKSFLMKPIVRSELAKTVRRVLDEGTSEN